MEVYWKERTNGQRLVCVKEGENEVIEIGGVRLTKNGYDAFALDVCCSVYGWISELD